MKYTITNLDNTEDLKAISALEDHEFGPSGTNNSFDIIRLQSETYPNGFFVVKLGDEVIGYMSSEKWEKLRSPKMKEDPRFTHSDQGKIVCLTTMVVREDCRGHGIGKALIDRLSSVAKSEGCEKIILSSPNSRSFYEKLGFQYLRNELDEGVDVAILMRDI